MRRGWSVPNVRRDYTKSVLALPAYVIARVLRTRLPGHAARLVRAGGVRGADGHWLLVSPRLVRRGAGGRRPGVRLDGGRRATRSPASSELGVDGVITNDPRLFEPA